MKIHFLLSRPNDGKPTAIKLKIHCKGLTKSKTGTKNVGRFVFGTGIQVHPSHWDFEKQRAMEGTDLPLSDRRNDPGLQVRQSNINNSIDRLSTAIRDYLEDCRKHDNPVFFPELKGILESIVKPDLIDEATKDPDHTNFIKDYIPQFIHEITTGTITTPQKDTKYSAGTIKSYRGFLNFWIEYEKATRRKVRFEDVDMRFYKSFVAYCHSQNLKYNYTGRRIKELKVIMKNAYKEGHHNNLIFKDEDFKTLKTKVDEVYLTEQELRQIHQLNLSEQPRMAIHRDVFLIGCYTALRFSDIIRITPDNIKHDRERDIYTIEMITRKTKVKVYIPIRPELMEIFERYDHQVPKVYEQKVNADIKVIAQMAGISGTISKVDIIGGTEVVTEVPRTKLIKTHTARRTAATLMYINGIPAIDIMKITGHQSEKTFLNYIRITNKQNADRLRDNAFFRGNPLRVAK